MSDRNQRAIVESPIAATWRSVQHEKAVLVGIGPGIEEADLDELAALAESAGAEPVGRVVQSRSEPDHQYWIGKGKVDELHDLVHTNGAELVIFDEELSPGHLRALEARLGVKVLDRTALILDIFALHAHTREGKAQVELAQLNYLLPRLRGWGEAMSRLGGGIGTRGPGESKLEVRPPAHPPAHHQASPRREGDGHLARHAAREPAALERAADRDRRLHQRGEVLAHAPPDRRRRDRRQPAVRDARPDDAPHPAAQRPGRDHRRHGRVRREAPARPGRGVPLDARGGDALRHGAARRRRIVTGDRRADRGSAPRARRDRRGPHAGGARAEQGRPRAGLAACAAGDALPGLRRRLGRHRRGRRRDARGHRVRGADATGRVARPDPMGPRRSRGHALPRRRGDQRRGRARRHARARAGRACASSRRSAPSPRRSTAWAPSSATSEAACRSATGRGRPRRRRPPDPGSGRAPRRIARRGPAVARRAESGRAAGATRPARRAA